ncbi:hypothetical protein H0H93_012813 [Arthromyces matolae]|nr:hypothetical protein H0H93_012813 [Arthromyces matolae]
MASDEKESISLEVRRDDGDGSATSESDTTTARLIAERKLVRKLDSRLLPTVVIIYIMNYIDSWQVTKNFAGILACRVFIGLPEAAFYPGTVYLLSRWYTKKELAFRSAILYGGLLMSNAFGAPHNTFWMSDYERHLAQARLSEDAGEADRDNREDSKRAAAMGIVNGIGNLGNLIGSYTWKAAWGPDYHQSMAISLASLAFTTLLAIVIRQILVRKNKQLDFDENAALKDADRTRVQEAARLEGLTFEQAMERRKGYRYLV